MAGKIVTGDRDQNGSFVLEDVIGQMADDGAGGVIFQFTSDVENATGGVGVACLQLCKMIGATVIAAAGSDEKCARLAELGN